MGGITEAVERVPVVGVSMTANIGGDRQIVLQGHYDRGDAAGGDVLIGEMNRRVDVLKAPHRIEEIEADLRKAREGLANMRKNLAVLDENAQREQAKRVIEIEEANAQLDAADKNARAAWTARGKEGEYREAGRVSQIRANVDGLLAKHAEKAREFESEKALAAEQCNRNVERFEREIAEFEGLLAKQRALLPDGG